jgi:hypothetical protein
VIPSSVTSIESGFLEGCSSLSGLPFIPSSVSSIGLWFLKGCSNLTEPPVIPSSVTRIGNEFLKCCQCIYTAFTKYQIEYNPDNSQSMRNACQIYWKRHVRSVYCALKVTLPNELKFLILYSAFPQLSNTEINLILTE